MRITSGMYYNNVYGVSNSQVGKELFDVNKQISSGDKIQYAKDGVSIFSETMRLDNEINILGQVKESTESGLKVSKQTDTVLNDFQTTLDRFKTLLIQGSNASQNDTSLDAIAVELRGLEDHFRNLANTSINGKYLFSGSDVDTKPISDDGLYHGNAESMEALLDSNVRQQYNLSGANLFLGEDITIKRNITTNIQTINLSKQYPDYEDLDTMLEGTEEFLTAEDSIRDMMGDIDNDVDTANPKHFFYISGTQSNGNSFREKIAMSDEQSVGELLEKIGEAFGNTPEVDIVNVTLNDRGEIQIEDKFQGSSKLDFHMVGATDFSNSGLADVNNINALDGAQTDFKRVIEDGYTPGLFVKEFVKSDYLPTDAGITTDALVYDRTQFEKDGSTLTGSIAQINNEDNSFATSSTKISEVAAGPLDGETLQLQGTNINGAAYDVSINFSSTGTTFSPDGGVTNYNIYTVDAPRVAVPAEEMSYQQLLDVVNMVVTDTLPASTSEADYDAAIKASSYKGASSLTYDGKLEFNEFNSTDTKATLSMFDQTSGDFSASGGSIITFNSNNALTIRDPKNDFFKTINAMIEAVEENKLYPNSYTGSQSRNLGMQNAIAMLDDLQTHVTKSHSEIGAYSNSLTRALDRVTLLEVSTVALRSSVVDTDLAEASMQLAQLILNYQAMFASVSKISQLSLVNYM